MRRQRSPVWLGNALVWTALLGAALAGQLEAHGWARVGWTVLLLIGASLLWMLWWNDTRP
jgi:hypothetical protein